MVEKDRVGRFAEEGGKRECGEEMSGGVFFFSFTGRRVNRIGMFTSNFRIISFVLLRFLKPASAATYMAIWVTVTLG